MSVDTATPAAQPTIRASVLPTTLPRRTVVAGAGVLALIGATSAPAQALGMGPGRRRPVVGVLTSSVPGRPASQRHGDALVAGLRIGLGGAHAKLLRAEVPWGYQGATDAAEKLLEQGADVLVVALSAPVAARLEDLCRRHKAGLVVANVGAHVVEAQTRNGRPTAVHTSAQHWQSALSTGHWAAANLGRTLHHVVAAPDAGYDSVFALRRGFTGAGGRVVGLSLTHQGAGVAGLVAEVRASKPAVVAISATGSRAAEIARALRAGGVRARFVLDPMAAEPFALGALGKAAGGAHTGGVRLDPKRLAALKVALRKSGASGPDAFSVLGHDTGLLVAAGVARLGGRPWSKLPVALAGVRVRGVRGEQRVHPRTGTVSVPLAVHKVKKVKGKRRAVQVATRPRIGGSTPAMRVVEGRNVGSYVNEYLTT